MILLLTIYNSQVIHQSQLILVYVSTIQKINSFFFVWMVLGEDAHCLLKLLQKHFTVTVDMEGNTSVT